jgi:hypothetical protein
MTDLGLNGISFSFVQEAKRSISIHSEGICRESGPVARSTHETLQPPVDWLHYGERELTL